MEKSRAPSEIFSARLKAARDLRGLSQTQAAEKSGLQPSAISHFETGTRKPSYENLKRLADALKVTTDYLLGRADDPNTVAAPSDTLYRNIQQLTFADRDIAEKMVEELAKRGEKK